MFLTGTSLWLLCLLNGTFGSSISSSNSWASSSNSWASSSNSLASSNNSWAATTSLSSVSTTGPSLASPVKPPTDFKVIQIPIPIEKQEDIKPYMADYTANSELNNSHIFGRQDVLELFLTEGIKPPDIIEFNPLQITNEDKQKISSMLLPFFAFFFYDSRLQYYKKLIYPYILKLLNSDFKTNESFMETYPDYQRIISELEFISYLVSILCTELLMTSADYKHIPFPRMIELLIKVILRRHFPAATNLLNNTEVSEHIKRLAEECAPNVRQKMFMVFRVQDDDLNSVTPSILDGPYDESNDYVDLRPSETPKVHGTPKTHPKRVASWKIIKKRNILEKILGYYRFKPEKADVQYTEEGVTEQKSLAKLGDPSKTILKNRKFVLIDMFGNADIVNSTVDDLMILLQSVIIPFGYKHIYGTKVYQTYILDMLFRRVLSAKGKERHKDPPKSRIKCGYMDLFIDNHENRKIISSFLSSADLGEMTLKSIFYVFALGALKIKYLERNKLTKTNPPSHPAEEDFQRVKRAVLNITTGELLETIRKSKKATAPQQDDPNPS